MPGHRIGSLLLALAVVAAAGGSAFAARKPKPTPCPAARYLVDAASSPLLAGAGPGTDAVGIDAQGRVTLDGCGPATRAKVKAARKFTLVNAKWTSCGGVAKLNVMGKVATPACDRLTAKLKGRKLKRKTFAALRGRCGDGRLDGAGGETCDASAPNGDDACPGRCQAADAVDACRCRAAAPGGGPDGPPDSPPNEPPNEPPDDPPPGTPPCADGLAPRPFAAGPTGPYRGDLAADFTVPLAGGGAFHLGTEWSGCESYVFVPDTITRSDLESASIWTTDLDQLVATSPRNAHYFFVSGAPDDAEAAASTSAMQQRVVDTLATLSAADATHWQARLHVVAGRVATLGGWVGDVLAGHGRGGFAIDRGQRVRDVGSLADVTRFSSQLQSAGKWPWKRNLAYVVHEVRWFNGEAARAARLAADGATVVPLWQGETLATAAETDALLPPAATMATFDTLEVEVTLACPDPEQPELGNCGAWDYLATLTVTTAGGPREVARFTTSYHRETHWIVDATHALPLLTGGGSHHFRWDFAQALNPQPTVTRLSLRLSSRGTGMRPTAATFLWSGGAFGSAYDAAHPPMQVAIPATARRVELVATITGHGAGTNQCAEFCEHQHEFTVGGGVHVASFPNAGVEDGCIAAADDGMIPNQGGTWWFGRGGWCPGQQVEPWVADVTADVTPGTMATIAYRGLFAGAPPPDGSGQIVLSSWLVVYE
jgi:hypothetical protein